MNDYFTGVIGQQPVRRMLSFYLDTYQQTGIFKNCLFISEKGAGKTMICRTIGERLGKPYIEINASAITSPTGLYDDVLRPYIIDRKATLMIDEIHCLNKKVSNFLLSILAPTRTHVNTIRFSGGVFDIDFRNFTFLAASTEAQLIFPPLRSRLKNITLGKYCNEDLKMIIQLAAGKIRLSSEVLDLLVAHCRINPRAADDLGKEVLNYCLVNEKTNFSLDDARNLVNILGLYEYGFTRLEIEILEAIERSNGASLTRLAAKSGLSPQSQRTMEHEMLAHDLIDIEKGRKITHKGIKFLSRNLHKY